MVVDSLYNAIVGIYNPRIPSESYYDEMVLWVYPWDVLTIVVYAILNSLQFENHIQTYCDFHPRYVCVVSR